MASLQARVWQTGMAVVEATDPSLPTLLDVQTSEGETVTKHRDFTRPSAQIVSLWNSIVSTVMPCREIPTPWIRGTIVDMFESYSIRAKRVIFVARVESGARGAAMLDLDDLLAGLIIEDQHQIPAALARRGMTGDLMELPKHHILASWHRNQRAGKHPPVNTSLSAHS
jgi:hypothetical protein